MAGEQHSHLLASLAEGALPPGADRTRFVNLFLEALVYTTVAVMLTGFWSERSIVFSIFLSAGAMVSRFRRLMDENRDLVWSGSDSKKREANVLTAASVFALFFGTLAVYLIVPHLMGIDAANIAFEPALLLDKTGLSRDAVVLATFFVLAFIYRAYGATLALSWNACVWGLTVAESLQTALSNDARPAWLAVGLTFGAVLPYLIFGTLSNVTGALSGIFLSQGLVKYGVKDARIKNVIGAVALLLLVSIGCLFVARTLARLL